MASMNFDDSIWKSMVAWSAVPVAIIGAAATACIYDFCKFLEARRQLSISAKSDYERVIRGEERNGWRLVVPAKDISDFRVERPYDRPLISIGLAKYDGGLEFESSVVTQGVRQLPDGKRCHILRRYSVLWPEKIHTTISKAVYNDNWLCDGTFHLTKDIVGSIYRETPTCRTFRLVLASLRRRWPCRVVELEAPFVDQAYDILMAYDDRASRRLGVAFGTWTRLLDQEDDDRRSWFEMSIAAYDLNVSEQAAGVTPSYKSVRNESLLVPCTRLFWVTVQNSWIPTPDKEITVMLYDIVTLGHHLELHRSRCVTFNRDGFWRVEYRDIWLANLKKKLVYDRTGWRDLLEECVESFIGFDPPAEYPRMTFPNCLSRSILSFLDVWGPFEPTFNACHVATKDGVFLKWIKPPSLKYLAASDLLASRTSSAPN